MLQDTSKDVRNCHHQAARCREMANHARTSMDREDCLDLEAHWLALARSYEHTERMTRYFNEVDRGFGG